MTVRRGAGLVAGLGLLALMLVLAGVAQGPADLPVERALRFLLSPDGSADADLVRFVRLPRALAALVAGIAFGIAGALLQAAVRNPLAEPGTLGVSAGASLAISLSAALGLGLGTLGSVPVAIVGGLAAGGLVLVLGQGGRDPVRLVLAGVAVGFVCAACAAGLQVIKQASAGGGVLLWGAGSAEQSGWEAVRLLAPAILLLGLVPLAVARELDALSLGDEAAEGLGVRAGRTRVIAGALGVLLACLAVALCGPIAFVGLAAPHLARRLGALRSRAVVLLAGACGAVLLLAADAIALALGGGAVAAGVVSTVAGAPVLVLLARRVQLPPTERAVRQRARRALRERRRLSTSGGVLLAVAALLGGFVASLAVGEVGLSPADAVAGLLGSGPDAFIVQELRRRRAAVAATAGASLGLCGALLQGVARNPLAAPELFGVTGGATLAAVVLVLVVDGSPTAVAGAALVGGVLALVLVVGLVGRRPDPARLVLIGVAVASAAQGIVDLLIARGGFDARQALILQAGSTYAEGWNDLAVLFPVLAVCGVLGLLLARRLDVLGGGDDLAVSLGVPPARLRLQALGLSAVLAATAVATVGAVGFVGLMAPHAARRLAGPGHRLVVPLSAGLGAALLLLADLVGRSVLPDARELPSGIVCALIGAPVIVLLLRRT